MSGPATMTGMLIDGHVDLDIVRLVPVDADALLFFKFFFA